MTINDLYRFWLDLPGKGLTQVYPFNSTLKWVDKKKQGYRFYQRTLSDSIELRDVPKDNIYDFTYLMDMERQGLTCTRVNITIDKWCDCDESWHEGFYNGYLRLAAGEWDVNECKVTIPIVVQDKFACLTGSWTNEVNMFDYGNDPITVLPFAGVLQRETCEDVFIHTYLFPLQNNQQFSTIIGNLFGGASVNYQTQCITPGEGWTLTKHTFYIHWEINQLPVASQIVFYVHIRSQWAREFVAGVTQPDGFGWIAVTGGWARAVNVIEAGILDHTTDEGLLAIQNEWGTDDFQQGYIRRLNIVGLDINGNPVFTNGKELGPVLEDLLGGCGLTVVSNFLNINPDGSNPDNIYYQNAEEDAHGLVLFQVTDLARVDETQSATIALMKLKELIDAQLIPFNCQCDIDGDIFRIEHLSYWPEVVQMDLTLAEFYSLIKERWKYTYDQEGFPKNEIIAWDQETDGRGKDFDGYPIEYDNACVNDQDEKADKVYSATHYLSNVLKIIGNEDFFDDTQTIVMVSTTNGVVNSALQPISGEVKLNGNLAMGYLIPRYYPYGRPFKEGSMNKILTPFYAILRNRLQAIIVIPFDCDNYLNNYTPGGLVKTQLGACEIAEATYSDPAQTLELKLRAK